MDIIVNQGATVHLHLYGNPEEITSALSRLAVTVNALQSQGVNIMATLDDLVQRVSDQSGTIDSMNTFIQGLEQQIADALAGVTLPPAVQTKLDSVFDSLGANTQKIADAIDNDPNTPAAPAPTPTP